MREIVECNNDGKFELDRQHHHKDPCRVSGPSRLVDSVDNRRLFSNLLTAYCHEPSALSKTALRVDSEAGHNPKAEPYHLMGQSISISQQPPLHTLWR